MNNILKNKLGNLYNKLNNSFKSPYKFYTYVKDFINIKNSILIMGECGKTATSLYLKEILKDSGLKVGVYNRYENLGNYNEMIKINDNVIDNNDKILLDCIESMISIIHKYYNENNQYPSHKIIIDAIQLMYLSRQQCDYNIISYHVKDIDTIASFIDPIIIGVTRILDNDHLYQYNVTLKEYDKSFITVDNNDYFLNAMKTYTLVNNTIDKKLSLPGTFQKENASLAKELAKTLQTNDDRIKDECIENSVYNTISNYNLRQQLFNINNKYVILNTKNNIANIKLLFNEFDSNIDLSKTALILNTSELHYRGILQYFANTKIHLLHVTENYKNVLLRQQDLSLPYSNVKFYSDYTTALNDALLRYNNIFICTDVINSLRNVYDYCVELTKG